MKCCDTINNKETIEFFKVLSEPNRIKILEALCSCNCAMNVNEICTSLEISQSVASRYLAKMKNSGMLDSYKQGKEVYYQVDVEKVCSFLRDLADFLENCCNKTKDK